MGAALLIVNEVLSALLCGNLLFSHSWDLPVVVVAIVAHTQKKVDLTHTKKGRQLLNKPLNLELWLKYSHIKTFFFEHCISPCSADPCISSSLFPSCLHPPHTHPHTHTSKVMHPVQEQQYCASLHLTASPALFPWYRSAPSAQRRLAVE